MAITVIASSDNKTAKLWAKSLFRDTLAKTYFKKFMGEGSGSIIQILPDTKKNRGDKVTYALRMQLSGDGRTGQEVLESNEEDLSFYDASLYIDLMRHAVKIDTSISQQRVEYDLRKEGRDALSDWWAARLDDYMFRYLAGDTSLTYAANTAVSADSSHVVYASTTAEVYLTTACVFTLSLLDKAVKKAKTVSPLIRPIRIDGNEYYAVILHPAQVYDLRTSTNTGQWLDIQKSFLQGSGSTSNPIFTGALGVYNGCILYESPRVYSGANGAGGATAYRSLFLGAQAGVVAFGNDNGLDQMTWREELFDYGKNLGIGASCIWGIQKNIFNSMDYGVISIITGATA
jgi:N4-gp56 family major capsid protein